MVNALLYSENPWKSTPLGSTIYDMIDWLSMCVVLAPIVVATQYTLATWIFSSTRKPTFIPLWTIGSLISFLLLVLLSSAAIYSQVQHLRTTRQAFNDYNPETGDFCGQDATFEANKTFISDNTEYSCAEVPYFLQNNVTLYQDIAGVIIDVQPDCCNGETRSTTNIEPTLHNMSVYGVPIVTFLGWIVFLFALWVKKNDAKGVGDEANTPESQEAPSSTVNAVPQSDIEAQQCDAPLSNQKKNDLDKQPIHYFTNIKIFLTCLVIIVHCNSFLNDGSGSQDLGIGFWAEYNDTYSTLNTIGLNLKKMYSTVFDIFAMSLFFFISGFFVAKSLNKKGRAMFLFERLKRIGIPAVLYSFLLGPYFTFAMSGWLMIGEYIPTPRLVVNLGPTWFLWTLLIFNIAYTYLCGKGWNVNVKFSLATIFISTAIVGVFEAILCLFFPEGATFFNILGFFERGSTYALVFWGGIIASQNNWMDGIKSMSRIKKGALYFGCIANIIVVYIFNGPIDPMYHNWLSKQSHGVVSIVEILKRSLITGQGLPTALWLLGMLTFFMDFMNFEIKTFSFTKTLSKAAYTAYLIQFLFPLQASLALITVILRAQGESLPFSLDNLFLAFPKNNFFSYWMLSSLMALVIDWLIAIIIVSIPGVSQVL